MPFPILNAASNIMLKLLLSKIEPFCCPKKSDVFSLFHAGANIFVKLLTNKIDEFCCQRKLLALALLKTALTVWTSFVPTSILEALIKVAFNEPYTAAEPATTKVSFDRVIFTEPILIVVFEFLG